MRQVNLTRIARAEKAIRAYEKRHGEDDDRTLLVDLLADLKHWATAKIKDVDLWAVDETAREHFNAEVLGVDDE